MAILNMKYGNYILQGEILQHMIILDSEGLPLYGYKFDTIKDSDDGDINDKEILFSGGFNSNKFIDIRIYRKYYPRSKRNYFKWTNNYDFKY